MMEAVQVLGGGCVCDVGAVGDGGYGAWGDARKEAGKERAPNSSFSAGRKNRLETSRAKKRCLRDWREGIIIGPRP